MENSINLLQTLKGMGIADNLFYAITINPNREEISLQGYAKGPVLEICKKNEIELEYLKKVNKIEGKKEIRNWVINIVLTFQHS